jgi:protein ImuB
MIGTLDCEAGPPVRIVVGLFEPSSAAGHLTQLALMQLEHLSSPGMVRRIEMQVTAAAPVADRQVELFADATKPDPRHLALLVDRLSSRLGEASVVQPRFHPSAQPERAFRYHRLTGRQPRRKTKAKGRNPKDASPVSLVACQTGLQRAVREESQKEPRQADPPRIQSQKDRDKKLGPLQRPWVLYADPLPLEVVAGMPDGPPASFSYSGRTAQIAAIWGPETVETGWWRGESVRRDYYRVETDSGSRFWLFRRIRDGAWFLHGAFE